MMFEPKLVDIDSIPWLSSSLRFYDDEGVPVIETEQDGCIALDDPVRTYPLERVMCDAVELTLEEFQVQFPQVAHRFLDHCSNERLAA